MIAICREDDNELLAYYSTEAQLEELLSKFQSEDLEKLLHESFSSSRDGIIGDMKVTESLTNKYKDSRKSCLSHDDGEFNAAAAAIIIAVITTTITTTRLHD